MRKVSVKELKKELELEVIWGNEFLQRKITKNMMSTPSVEIYAGYFDFFEKDRVQVIGSKELTIFNNLEPSLKKARIDTLFSFDSPAFVFTRGAIIPDEFLDAAIKHEMPILRTVLSTSAFIGNATAYLSSSLAERITVEGAMLDVYGVGVLIKGKKGIGKSETALELIKRGHILVSDEETRLYQREPGLINAEAPKVSERLMNILDIGVVNVMDLFGIGSFRNKKRLMLIVELVTDDSLGDSEEIYFDTHIPKITITVSNNRNIPSLIEAAALNNQLKSMGRSGDEEYLERINNRIKR